MKIATNKLKFLFIGNTKNKDIENLEREYIKYLSKYCVCSIDYLKEEKGSETVKIKKSEGDKILDKIKKDDFIILLEVTGKQFSSEEFSKKIEYFVDNGISPVFVVAGPFGASENLKTRANLLLSFSNMTFTHEMIRPLLFEQIFRAFSILVKNDYHK